MSSRRRFLITLLAAGVISWIAADASLAQSSTESDTREVNNYVLTEQSLANFTQASSKLHALEDQTTGNCAEGENPESLDEMAARLDAVPGATQAIESAGMTTREYFVFSLSLLQNGMAAWALEQPGGELPPGTSMANVEFYRAHETEFQQLGRASEPDDCEDEESYDDADWAESDG